MTTWNGPDELGDLLVPVEELKPLPGNPNVGDVEAVVRSYQRFGQRKPIVSKKKRGKRIVVAGNTQLKAAQVLGWTHIAVLSADDLTENEARAFALADNRTSELGKNDPTLLVELIQELADIDVELLMAASYDEDDIADLFDDILGEELPEPGDADVDDLTQPSYGVIVLLDNDQQQRDLLAEMSERGFQVKAMIQ